jgi:hypothetical protein
MDSVKRERVIELGAQIAGWRAEIAALQSKVSEAETEIDRLFPDAMASRSSSTDGATAPVETPADADGSSMNGAFSKLMSRSPEALAAIAAEAAPHPKSQLVIPSVIGNLADQALAVLQANPDRLLTGEVITEGLNRMVGRATLANYDSVNAALSRLATDGMIVRVERGVYRAKTDEQ